MPITFNKPFISGKELYFIADAVMSGKIAGDGKYGRICEAKLEEMIGGDCKALLTTSCTSALEISAILLDLKPGDEVILPSYTFVSTANAFCLRGATPVFADIDPKTLNIDVDHVERLITKNTKAIVPVHYAGFSCDMNRLMEIADSNNIIVIEDAAQAITSSYMRKPLGSFGDMATLSFHETKNINCGEGGALILNNPKMIERAEVLREKGTNRAQFFRGQVDKYTWVDTGSSYVMSDVLAAYLAAQLENVDEIQARRLEIYERYAAGLAGLSYSGHFYLPFKPAYNEGNAHMFYLLLADLQVRTDLIAYLKERNIDAVFHYVPLHSSPVGKTYGYKDGDLPVTEDVSSRLVRLPMYVSLTNDDVDRVIAAIVGFFKN